MTPTPTINVEVSTPVPTQRGSVDGSVTWPLVERAQAGDREALAELYRIYHPMILGMATVRVSRRVVAEDIAAETWVRAIRNIGNLSWQGRDFAAWLVTIVRNLIADHYKSGRYQREVITGDGLADLAEQLDDGIESEIVERLARNEALEVLSILTAQQREVLELRFLGQLDVAEVAERLGMTIGGTKALQYRATRALRAALNIHTDNDRPVVVRAQR